MNELQNIEFQMLKEFVRICEELKLTYYLVCGSALGAAKYQGFIPWDDDMDVALPRPDYEVFCEKAPSMLPEYYFLQNHKTDPYYPLIFSKLRDSRTTYIENAYAATDMHHGVYIDVFPLDGYPEDAALANQVEREKHRYKLCLLACLKLKRTFKTALLVSALWLLGVPQNPARLVERLTTVIAAYPTEGSHKLCNHGNWQGKLEYAPKEQYGEGVLAKFEGLQVRIPEQFDEYLTQKYGDWRADLPEDQKIGHHFYEVCDLHRPYTAYVEKLSNGKIRLINPG